MLNKLELLDIATYQRELHPVLMSQQPLVLSLIKSNVYLLHLPWCGFIDESVRCWRFTRSSLYISLPAIIPDQASLKLGTKWRRFSSFLLMCRVTTKILPNQRSMHFPNSFAYMHKHASNMHNEFLFWVSSSYCSCSFLTMHCIEALCVCCWEWLILLQMHIHSHNLMQWALIFGSVILQHHLSWNMYRSGTVNSNTVNSKFHLIRSYCEYLARILSFYV